MSRSRVCRASPSGVESACVASASRQPSDRAGSKPDFTASSTRMLARHTGTASVARPDCSSSFARSRPTSASGRELG